MKIKILALALGASAVITGAADAANRTFTISNGTFTDGGTFGGSFDYNDTSYQYSNVNIFVKGGLFSDHDYGTDDMDFGFSSALALNGPELRFFNTTFSQSLDYSVSSNFISYIYGYELNSVTNDDREIRTGFLTVAAIPESSTWAMMLVGFGLIGASARYRRRSAKVTYA